MNRHVPTYRLYRADPQEPTEFWLHSESIPARSRLHNWEIQPHRHDTFFQLLHISNGSGEALLEGRYLAFAAPALIFVPPREVHGFRFSRDIEGCVITSSSDRLAAIAGTDRAIGRFASKPRLYGWDTACRHADGAAAAIDDIARELRETAIGRPAMLEALVTAAIVRFTRAHSPQPAADALPDARATRLAELLENHFREQPPAAFFAARIGVSTAHLNRIARAAFGESVRRLVARQLVRAARRDLIFTPTSVQAIAFSLGFADPAYFNRFFRKETGLTPGAFRDGERRKLSVTG